VTLLPTYLNEAFGIPLEQVGSMQSTALTIGCLGMIFGGVFTDWLRARLGPRLGRSVPICATLTGCAVGFLGVPTLPPVAPVPLTPAAPAPPPPPAPWVFVQLPPALPWPAVPAAPMPTPLVLLRAAPPPEPPVLAALAAVLV